MHSCGMSITGETIKAAREALKETQAAFAERFGVNQSTIDRWESKGPPGKGTASRAIERVLSEVGALPEARA